VSPARDDAGVDAAVEPDFDRAADAFRRRIRVEAVGPYTVVAALEDDFHHFVVTLGHDGECVTECTATAHRWPWATCPDAGAVLQELVAMPLADRFTAVAAVTNPRHHCTHQLDAAAHAVTHARTGRDRRQYDIEVPAPDARGVSRARLWVDGVLDLEWRRAGNGLVDPPPPFDAAPWKGGFMRWADATLEPDAAERAIVLRRACDIGMGRGMQAMLDRCTTAAELPEVMTLICFTMQPAQMPVAFRNRDHYRDFAAEPERLLAST
jgi:hypothetical protein